MAGKGGVSAALKRLDLKRILAKRPRLDPKPLLARLAPLWALVPAWLKPPPRRQLPPPRMAQYSGRPIWRAVNRTAVGLFIALFCFVYGFAYALFTPALLPVFAIPIAILALLVVWALPDRRNPPTRPLEWLFFAFFICLALWPDYLAISLPGLPWITLLRLTGIPMSFLLLICVSTSAQFRTELGQSIRGAPPLTVLLVLFVGLQAVSIGLSHNPGLSIQKFIVAQTNWTAMFFTAAYLFRKPGRIERWGLVFWGTAIIVGLMAVWEARVGHVLWAGHIPAFLKIEDDSVAKILAGGMRAYTNRYRAQATFGTPLGLSEYLALAMPFALYFMSRRFDLRLRLAAMASIPVLFYGVILTDSRLGVVGCLMTFLMYGLFSAVRLWRLNRSSILGPAISLAYPVVFAGAVAATFVVPRLKVMVWGGGAQQASTNARVEQYALGIPKILHNPFGYGIGMGADTLGYAPFGDLTIDTYYLSIALEYGVLGFIIYYGMVATSIFHAGRRALDLPSPERPDEPMAAPLAIAMIEFLAIKSVFSQQDNHPVVYMIMGAVAAMCARSASARAASPARAAHQRSHQLNSRASAPMPSR